MRILCFNCGGSSLKCQLFAMPEEKVLAEAHIDRLNTPQATIKIVISGQGELGCPLPGAAAKDGVDKIIATLTKCGIGVDAVAHKLAHGGEKYKTPVLIDRDVLDYLPGLFGLAPVHMPPMVDGIQACAAVMPAIPQYAVFETGFHQTLAPAAYTYGVPHEWHDLYGVRKYGFHGSSHQYVAETTAKMLGLPLSELRIISCHLGSGTSVAAIKFGTSFDISSGLTPQSGTLMSTRPGDFDPWLVPYMTATTGLSTAELFDILTKKGGLAGISGLSGDMRDLEEAYARGNRRAGLAIEALCYQVKKYIGAFTAAMNGLDALVFTGGIGARSALVRELACRDLEYLGIEIDGHKNGLAPGVGNISAGGSPVRVLVFDTNEELMVARQVHRLIQSGAC